MLTDLILERKKLKCLFCVCSIDATNMCGRAGSLVNDSDKDANCAVKKVVVDGRCHLAIFAKADIDIGAELLYDYGDATNLWWRKVNYLYLKLRKMQRHDYGSVFLVDINAKTYGRVLCFKWKSF